MKTIIIQSILYLLAISVMSQDIIMNDAPLPEAEFHTAINPTDNNNIVLATIHGFSNPSGNNLRIYYSHDLGETWQISDYQGEPDGYTGAGDAILGYNAEGIAFLTNLSGKPDNKVYTILSKSPDGGGTWSLVSIVAQDETDKPWMAIDRFATSPHKGNIYVPVVENVLNLYCLDDNYQTIYTHEIPDGEHLPCVVVRKNGDIFTSTIDFGTDAKLFVQQYTSGGAVFEHSTQVTSFPDYTFNLPNISMRYQPTVYLAIDNSGGAYDGRLYLSYTASENTNPLYMDILLTYSDDNGHTWSTPKAVPTAQQDEVQQFYSSIYVNNQGILILDWYDRKNYSNTNKQTDFYMGISYNGGETFTEIQLNSASSDFDYIISSSDEFGIGEYHQLVATDNTAISFWSDGRTNDGDLNIYMAKVSLNSPVGVEEFTIVSEETSISTLYPQPANEFVHTDIQLKENTRLKYEVFDNLGKKISENNWIDYLAGKHTISIKSNFIPGIYYVRFASDNGYFKTMKFIAQ
jgi:hypothetical protein